MTTEQKIAKLEARIDKLQEAQGVANHKLAQAYVEQWQGRIDDLEVQIHLGMGEANDRVTALVTDLRSRWSKAHRQLGDAASTTSEVTDTLRSGIEAAYADLRRALLESRKQLT